MAHPEDERKAFGARLAVIRKDAGFTMEQAAEELTKRGYPITKQGLGHWESGRNVPDAFWLRRLSRLYQLPVDAFFTDGAIELETYRLAEQLRTMVLRPTVESPTNQVREQSLKTPPATRSTAQKDELFNLTQGGGSEVDKSGRIPKQGGRGNPAGAKRPGRKR